MIVIIAIDDGCGLLFNNRRQSQDAEFRKYIMNLSRFSKLYMNEFSSSQFESHFLSHITIDESPLVSAEDGDFCFAENLDLNEAQNRIEKLILCKWNRAYPSDKIFDIDLTKPCWRLTSTSDIKGKSHEKITIEEWTKLNDL